MKLLNYLMVCALGLSTLCFTACEKNDEPGENNLKPTPAVPADKSLLVYSYAEGPYDNLTSKFVYTPKRVLTKGKWRRFSFDISEPTFYLTSHNNKIRFNTETNEDGYIDYMFIYNEKYKLESTINITYDGDYMTKLVYFNESIVYRTSVFYTWENGNITRIRYQYNNEEEVIYSFTYDTNTQNNPNIYIPHMTYDVDLLYYGGYMGKPTANIPTKVAITEDGETKNYDITVKYDDKNRIVEYRENGALKCIYAYDGKTAEWPADEPYYEE